VAAALLYAVLSLGFVGQGLLPGRTLASTDLLWSLAPWTADRPAGVHDLGANYEMADAVAQFQPFLAYTRSRLPDVPLWNPDIEGGRPLLANMQSAVFSPFSWPAYVLPFWWSLGLIAALKLWAMAFGTFLLARALGLRMGGALLAGVVAGFGLFHVVWLAWPLSGVWAWLPWVLLATDATVRRPGPRPVAALALAVALQFAGGHPETSFHVLAVAVLFALLRLPDAGRVRALGRFAGGLAAGAALSAAFLLPFLELLAHSSDVAQRAAHDAARSPRHYLLSLALPDYWGRPTQVVTEPFIVARAFYAGALPLMLACLAVLRPSKERLWIAAAGAVALLVVVGQQPFFGIVNALPGFHQAHNTRLAIVTLLAIALLAGWGLDDLARLPRRRGLVIAGAIAVLPALIVLVRARPLPLGDALRAAWGFATPERDELPLMSLLIWLPFAAAAVALIARRPRAAVALALVLTFADLARAGMGQNPAIPLDHARTPVTGALAFLQRHDDQRFVAAGASVLPPLNANVGMRYGLRDARGYDYPTEEHYDAFWRRAVNPPDPLGITLPSTQATTGPAALRALGLLSVGYVLTPPEDAPLALPLAYQGPDARVYANPAALPRAFLVGAQRVTGDQLGAVTAPGFDPREAAVVSASAGLPARAPSPGTARLVRDDPERVAVRTRAGRRALLVLTDSWFPGWRATVDGRDAPIVRTDQLLRGVAVPAGTHTVEFAYRPLSWRIGWIVSLLAAAGLAVAARRRR
jgi:hypothetical protein